jgi:hypothetical protein
LADIAASTRAQRIPTRARRSRVRRLCTSQLNKPWIVDSATTFGVATASAGGSTVIHEKVRGLGE